MEQSIERSREAISHTGEQREAEGGISSASTIDGLGSLVVSKEFYCDRQTFNLNVSVTLDDAGSQLVLVLQPHGGPDPGSDEYIEEGSRLLEPDVEGNAEVAIYDLPASATLYELVDRSNTFENPIMTFSGAPLVSFCNEQIVQDSEHETDEPEIVNGEASAPGMISVNPEIEFDILYSFMKECQTEDTYMITIHVEYLDIPEGFTITPIDFVSNIGPHGGPDEGSPEFNPDTITEINLSPGESALVTVEDLSAMGLYEWITPTQDIPIESFDGSGVDFEACPIRSDEPAHEEPGEAPADEVPREPIDDSEAPDAVEEIPIEEDETPIDIVDEFVGSEAEEATTEHTEQQPKEELGATGGDTLLLAALGLAAVFTGARVLRRSRLQKV